MGGVFLLIMIFALIIISPIIIIATIISVIAKRKSSNPNKGAFEKTVRAIYVYFILICCLCAIIGGVISTFNYALDIILPEESYDTSEELYDTSEREKNRNIVDLSTNLAIFLVAIPIFVYHSKIAKKSNKEDENIENAEKSYINEPKDM